MAYFAHEIGHVLDTLNGMFHTRAQYGKNGYEVVADDYAINHWVFKKASEEVQRNIILHRIFYSNDQFSVFDYYDTIAFITGNNDGGPNIKSAS